MMLLFRLLYDSSDSTMLSEKCTFLKYLVRKKFFSDQLVFFRVRLFVWIVFRGTFGFL